MTQPDRWREVTAARIPAECLNALGPVRNVEAVRIHPDGEAVWICWPAGLADIVNCLLPVSGVVFFVRRRGEWFRFASRLPTTEAPPDRDGLPLAAKLIPARFESIPLPNTSLLPVELGIVRGGEPRPACAMACSIHELLRWADLATTAELAAVRAARCGERVVVLGARLPSIPAAIRFWGKDVLVPVGFRPDPDLSATTLRMACGATDDELLLLDESGAEIIPRTAFETLTRAGVRLGATPR